MEVYPCECKYENSIDFINFELNSLDDPETRCGLNSQCINKELNMECTEEECPMGNQCRNRRLAHTLFIIDTLIFYFNRFQLCQNANIEIIETEKKGFGLKTKDAIKKYKYINVKL